MAACAGSAFAPDVAMAQAPKLGPPVAGPVWNWTGFYVGAHLGNAWQQSQTAGSYFDGGTHFPFVNDTSVSGFLGGGQIGYNWQTGIAVFGVEADLSGLPGSRTVSQSITTGGVTTVVTSRNEIEWLGTIRGRAGLVIGGSALLYGTGGFAYGDVSNVHSEVMIGFSSAAAWQEQTTRSGYVLGGGLEYMFAPNWTARLEGLFVNLGTTAVNPSGTCANACQVVTFDHQATILRAAVNFKFP